MPLGQVAIKSARVLVTDKPAGTRFVCTRVVPTVQTTTSASPSTSATFTERVPRAPEAWPHFIVSGTAQEIVGGELLYSYEPISMMLSPGKKRGKPRWSMDGEPALSPASMAWLPQSRAWV